MFLLIFRLIGSYSILTNSAACSTMSLSNREQNSPMRRYQQMTTPGPRIFMSHSHLDNAFVTRLAQDLRRALGDESAVWYDILGLHGGDTWWEKIVEELMAREVFLLVLSSDAMNSRWVRREINMALNENKSILPVLHRDCSIRPDLKILQIITFLAPKSYEVALREVLVALGLPTGAPIEPKERASQPTDPASALLRQL